MDKQNVGIVGSRGFDDYELLKKSVLEAIKPELINMIISGGAVGADTLAEEFAREFSIPVKVFKPNRKKYGYEASHMRNTEIVENSTLILAFWDGHSTGTKDSLVKAERMGIPVILIYF